MSDRYTFGWTDPRGVFGMTSPKTEREKVVEVMGRDIQVPYLVDPNTGVKMFESAKIVEYLKKQYGQ